MTPYAWKFWRLSWRFPENGIVCQEDWHGRWKCVSGPLFFLVQPMRPRNRKPRYDDTFRKGMEWLNKQ